MSKAVLSRWYVEVFPDGATRSEQRYCVQAERWKSALKKARALAGEKGSITGYIGERREGGYHVREPMGRMAYFIRKAPANATLGPSSAEVPAPVGSIPAPKQETTRPRSEERRAAKQEAEVSRGEERRTAKPRFRRLFRIFSSLRPPLRVSASSRYRSAQQEPAPEEREPLSVADADAAGGAAPSSPWHSSPVAANARPGEYLIGKLFEQMHGLYFMPDLISGANFVADVLSERIPCAGLLIHVFDINRREFVVVRARGPRDEDVLLHRSPDDQGLFVGALRREMVLQIDPREYESFDSVRFNKLGLVVSDLLCGPVHQGRRYLGVIELANPLTDRFSEAQAHALEYVCNQFADFVAARPVVIDEEAVLATRSNAGAAG